MEREKFCALLFSEMVTLYKTGEISSLCLKLQQDFDADVPLFLICLMADRAGFGLSDPAFAQWVASAEAWRETVIRPLRGVRVELRPQREDPAINALRERVKATELEAEKLHVEMLGTRFLAGQGEGDLAARYLRLLGLGEAEIRHRLTAFGNSPKA